MYLRGRTAALLVVLSVVLSSVTTAMVVGNGGLLSIVTGSSPLLTGALPPAEDAQGLEDNMDKLKQAYALIKGRYIHGVSDQKLVDGAIHGMVEALDDPYSAYMDKKTAEQFHSTLESSFQGIGAEVTLKNGRVTIVSPFKDSPAEKAGLRPDDQIIKVNGKSLEGMSLNEAVSKIKGPKGSKAHLQVVRPGHDSIMKITVIRDEIPIETVRSKMLEGKVGKIEITQFSTDTAKDFEKALNKLEDQGMKGLVIDVRGNPGGLLPSVLKISEQLVPHKKTIMMTEDKAGNRLKYQSKLEGKKPYPIVVVTDKGSASASEILAAALKESGGYPVVGQQSFGKGTVQTAEDFADGSNIKLTMAKWLTPKGNWIHKKGVTPDVKVKLPDYYKATPPQAEKPLKRDMASDDVRNLQLVLDAIGFRTDRKDGYFSAQTETAVKAFQKTNNLPVTGVVDKKTAMKLQEKFLSTLRKPESDLQLRVAIETLKKNMK
ncbi:carboxy-terminal processing protease CtpB [Marinithermofilum abyssi]|uniref:Carboxy-terminal processing protease CtpB n=1 Tax=Marinithermofilum abyssi TaxID=1571185 RepID=A0A8J2VGZ6_9BACL|nr:S41 family peptidase [Marinithermofilum abyssi]GGE04597.1 carboxy-terminal processing protease CtpB [Marinithermofilum abyssi]